MARLLNIAQPEVSPLLNGHHNQVVQIAVRPHRECCGQDTLPLEFAYRDMRSGIAIQRDLLGGAPFLNRLPQEPLGRGDITPFTQDKVDRLPPFVDPAVEVDPFAFDLD